MTFIHHVKFFRSSSSFNFRCRPFVVDLLFDGNVLLLLLSFKIDGGEAE